MTCAPHGPWRLVGPGNAMRRRQPEPWEFQQYPALSDDEMRKLFGPRCLDEDPEADAALMREFTRRDELRAQRERERAERLTYQTEAYS